MVLWGGHVITVYGLKAFMPQLKGLVRDIRVVWTLEELGLPYERKVMDATVGEHKQPEYLAINPFGKVPAIRDGETVMFESMAICTYLGDKAGKLLPAPGTRARNDYYQWMAFLTTTLEAMAARVVGIDFFENDPGLKAYRDGCLETTEKYFAVLNKELAERAYILGESFSIADIFLSSTLRYVTHTEVVEKYPNLRAYRDTNFARPAFERALENNG